MNKTWHKTLSVGVVLAISLTGCASKQTETKPTKTAKPTQVASSPKQGGEQKALAEKKKLGTWEGPPPQCPPICHEHSKDGAATTAANWIRATDYAIFTGNTESLEKATSSSMPAFAVIRKIKEEFKKRGKTFGKPLQYKFDLQEVMNENTFDTQFIVEEYEHVSERGDKIPGDRGIIRIRTIFQENHWVVEAVTAEKDNQ
ncbi:MAG: DUF6318 family protein [Actinomycetaceae bacterium]|nr:DUF6318 family protein [Actinomycetaceae bacterium]